MKEVAFLPRFHPMIRTGRKVCTTRRSKLGKRGDILLVKGSQPPIKIRILEVSRTRLMDVAAHFYREEGFDNQGGFVVVWNEIHPRSRFHGNALKTVNLHFFEVAKS